MTPLGGFRSGTNYGDVFSVVFVHQTRGGKTTDHLWITMSFSTRDDDKCGD